MSIDYLSMHTLFLYCHAWTSVAWKRYEWSHGLDREYINIMFICTHSLRIFSLKSRFECYREPPTPVSIQCTSARVHLDRCELWSHCSVLLECPWVCSNACGWAISVYYRRLNGKKKFVPTLSLSSRSCFAELQKVCYKTKRRIFACTRLFPRLVYHEFLFLECVRMFLSVSRSAIYSVGRKISTLRKLTYRVYRIIFLWNVVLVEFHNVRLWPNQMEQS